MKTFEEAQAELNESIKWDEVPADKIKEVKVQVVLDALVIATNSGDFEMSAISDARDAIMAL